MLLFNCTVNFPFCQQKAVWYKPINQLYINDWLVLYPRGLWGKWVEILSCCISVFAHAHF